MPYYDTFFTFTFSVSLLTLILVFCFISHIFIFHIFVFTRSPLEPCVISSLSRFGVYAIQRHCQVDTHMDFIICSILMPIDFGAYFDLYCSAMIPQEKHVGNELDLKTSA